MEDVNSIAADQASTAIQQCIGRLRRLRRIERTVDFLIQGAFLAAGALAYARSPNGVVWFACLFVGGMVINSAGTVLLFIGRRKQIASQAAESLRGAPLGLVADLTDVTSPLAFEAREALCARIADEPTEIADTLTCGQMRAIAAVVNVGAGADRVRRARPVLSFLARAGDSHCLGALERAASAGAPAADDRLVRQDARACLAQVRARLAQRETGALLVRPAGPAASKTLLRPAGHLETDESLLVRPAGTGAHDRS